MKIVHLCLCGPYNDYWGYQDNLIPKYNIKDGHEVTVITSVFVDSKNFVGYDKVNPGEYSLDTGEKIIRIPFLKDNIFFEKLRIYNGLTKHLKIEKPDLIFMHGIQFLDMESVVKYIKKNPNCKLVADNHASYDNSANNLLSRVILHKVIWRKIIKRSLPYIQKLFMVTPGCKTFAEEMYHIPVDKMEYLFLGADIEKINYKRKVEIRKLIRENLNIRKEDFVLITGGKLSKGKNVKLLLDAMKKIKDQNLKLIIFGTISEDIRVELMEKINKDSRVKYIGWLKADEVYDYYLASDIAIFTGTKSALWEQAICSGLPLICKRWKGTEYVDVGGNCIFIDNDNEEQIINSIELLLYDKRLTKKMQKVSETKGIERFSYEKISRQAIEGL